MVHPEQTVLVAVVVAVGMVAHHQAQAAPVL
jgi:hypothetical protein